MTQVQCQGMAPKLYEGMNSLERAYAAELEIKQASGEILWWDFEGTTLKIAKDTRYTPDFTVLFPDGRWEFHETKGFWRDDARCKIKVAASKFWMFTFMALRRIPKRDGGGWKVEVF